jgi:4-amino-4-deoxy-L-arabinose transferase-like glycosyltransferase
MAFVAAAIVLGAAIATISPTPIGVFWDDGVYLVSARALATGAGYRFVHLPGAPPAVHFPPGWPALLALVWTLRPGFPENVAWLKMVNPILLGVAAWLACTFGVRRLDLAAGTSAAATVLFATALPVLVIAGVLFSEPLFLAGLFVCLGLAETARERGGWRPALAAGAAAGGLMLVRTAGIALLPALVLALVVARRRREALVSAAAAVAVLTPWQLWLSAHASGLASPLRGSYGPYVEWVLALYRERGPLFVLTVARQNALSLVRSSGVIFFPLGTSALRPLLVMLLLVIFVVGAARAWRKTPVAVLFVLAYAPIFLAWPYAPERFVWAVWPLVGLFLAAGATECWRVGAARPLARGVRASAALVVSVALLACAGHATYTARGLSRHWWDVAQRRNASALLPVAEWVNANTDPGDVVACDGESLVHLYTGRTVVPVHILSPDEYLAGTPLEQAAADLRAIFLANRPRYAVFSAVATELAAAPLLDGAGGSPRLDRIAQLPGGGAAFRVVLP